MEQAAIPGFASFDGTVVCYGQAGRGEAVLLLRSFPFDSRIWASIGVAGAITAAAARSSLRTAVAAAGRAGRMIRARTRVTPAHGTLPG